MSLEQDFQNWKKTKPITTKPISKNFWQKLTEVPQTATSALGKRAETVISDVQGTQKIAEEAGGTPLSYGLSGARTAGRIAGQVAGGAGDIIGSAISPFLPEEVKSTIGDFATKINTGIDTSLDSIAGMTPELKQEIKIGLEDVFNTATLLGGAKVEPKVIAGAEKGLNVIKKEVGSLAGDITDVGKLGIEEGTNIFEKIAKKPIPKQVESALKEIDTNTFDKYAQSAIKASESYKNPTPLEIAGQSAKNALDDLNNKISEIGKNKQSITSKIAQQEKSFGNVFNAKELVDNSINSIKKNVNNLGLSVYKDGTIAQTSGKVSKIPMNSKDIASLNEVMTILKRTQENPSFVNIDNAIDAMQEVLYKRKSVGAEPINKSLEGLIKSEVGKLNNSLKEYSKGSTYQNYADLSNNYSRLLKLRNELNTKLGKGGERGGSLMKRVFSPSDANTKLLFDEIKKETGIDLVNEATMAKYTMEVAGDARQASLLEELKLPKSSGDVISKSLDYLWNKMTKNFNTPEKILERARKKTKNQ